MTNANPAWQRDAVAWYTDPAALDVLLAPDGPEDVAAHRARRGPGATRPARPRRSPTSYEKRHVDQLRRRPHRRAGAREDVVLPELGGVGRRTARTASPPTSWSWCPPSEHVELTYGNTRVEYLGWGTSRCAAASSRWASVAWRGPVHVPGAAPRRRRRRRPRGDGHAEAHGAATRATRRSRRACAGSRRAGRRRPPPTPVGFWDSVLAERNGGACGGRRRVRRIRRAMGERAGRSSSTRTGISWTTIPARSPVAPAPCRRGRCRAGSARPAAPAGPGRWPSCRGCPTPSARSRPAAAWRTRR